MANEIIIIRSAPLGADREVLCVFLFPASFKHADGGDVGKVTEARRLNAARYLTAREVADMESGAIGGGRYQFSVTAPADDAALVAAIRAEYVDRLAGFQEEHDPTDTDEGRRIDAT